MKCHSLEQLWVFGCEKRHFVWTLCTYTDRSHRWKKCLMKIAAKQQSDRTADPGRIKGTNHSKYSIRGPAGLLVCSLFNMFLHFYSASYTASENHNAYYEMGAYRVDYSKPYKWQKISHYLWERGAAGTANAKTTFKPHT